MLAKDLKPGDVFIYDLMKCLRTTGDYKYSAFVPAIYMEGSIAGYRANIFPDYNVKPCEVVQIVEPKCK